MGYYIEDECQVCGETENIGWANEDGCRKECVGGCKTRPPADELVSKEAYEALMAWPCAGMGEKKKTEVMRFVNIHQNAIIKGLELLSGKTRSEAIEQALSNHKKGGGDGRLRN